MADPEILQEFLSIVACTTEVGQYWLEVADNNIGEAVELFFSADTAKLHQPTVPQSSPGLDYIEPNMKKFQDDKKGDIYGEEEVRKPDSVKKQRLMDEGGGHEHMLQHVGGRTKALAASAFASASNQVVSARDQTLAKIFSPPHEIMTNEDLWTTREMGKAEGKWILINIQRDEDFGCHMVNRDFWSDVNIREIVSMGFLFWQQQDVSIEGRSFCERYAVQMFPHICILDPRTGAVLWTYTKKLEKTLFTEQLLDFLGSHPYPEGSKPASSRFSIGGQNTSHSQPGAKMIDLSSDEDALAAAINMSIGEDRKSGNDLPASSGTLPASSGTSSKLSGTSTADDEGGGFDPAELPSIASPDSMDESSTNESAAALTPKVKIMFKQGSSKMSVTLDVDTSVLTLASHAVRLMAETLQIKNKRFELLLAYPRKALSEITKVNSKITLKEIGILSDTAIIVQII
mmetsp:Transcript_26346/g.25202  ORF Transcript_26346/g.25202 Transcript_26346/m.25202 type:complete len:459 (+) Transcript_26346:9-1385(+)